MIVIGDASEFLSFDMRLAPPAGVMTAASQVPAFSSMSNTQRDLMGKLWACVAVAKMWIMSAVVGVIGGFDSEPGSSRARLYL